MINANRHYVIQVGTLIVMLGPLFGAVGFGLCAFALIGCIALIIKVSLLGGTIPPTTKVVGLLAQ